MDSTVKVPGGEPRQQVDLDKILKAVIVFPNGLGDGLMFCIFHTPSLSFSLKLSLYFNISRKVQSLLQKIDDETGAEKNVSSYASCAT